MDRPFLVDDQRVGPGLGKRVQEPIRLLDHQVDFQGNRGDRPQPADDHGTKREVWYEVAVHDVNVNPVSPRGHDLSHLLSQPALVGRQDRGGEFDIIFLIIHVYYITLVKCLPLFPSFWK